MGTELAVLNRGKEVLKKTTDLNTVATAMVTDELAVQETTPFPKIPGARELTEDLRELIASIPGVFSQVNLDERRTLKEHELVALRKEQKALDTVVKALDKRIEDIKEIVRTGMDADAEERGLAIPKAIVKRGQTVEQATPRDKDGHYILAKGKGRPYRLPINNTGEVYSQEYRNGSVTVDGQKLMEMHERGEIPRDVMLAFTREARVLDEAKAAAYIRDHPEEGLEYLKAITTIGTPGTSLCVRKA